MKIPFEWWYFRRIKPKQRPIGDKTVFQRVFFIKKKLKNNPPPRPPELWGGFNPTIRTLEHCFFTKWARFRVYPTKIQPFERKFHAEFENEGPGASFFDVDVVFE